MAKTKNKIANDVYGEDFEYLTSGQKRAVTVKFNAQPAATPRTRTRRTAASNAVVCKIGVIGNGPLEEFALEQGDTVGDLLDKSSYSQSDKEGIVAQSTGNSVDLDDDAENGEIYVIAPEIKSAK